MGSFETKVIFEGWIERVGMMGMYDDSICARYTIAQRSALVFMMDT
jgi:hypothetical protein